jgi:hypothetical protein
MRSSTSLREAKYFFDQYLKIAVLKTVERDGEHDKQIRRWYRSSTPPASKVPDLT